MPPPEINAFEISFKKFYFFLGTQGLADADKCSAAGFYLQTPCKTLERGALGVLVGART